LPEFTINLIRILLPSQSWKVFFEIQLVQLVHEKCHLQGKNVILSGQKL